MQIHVQNQSHERVSEKLGDDIDESFLSACHAAADGSVMSGVFSVGDTMFNELQLPQFARELNELPEEQKTDTIRRVADMAQQAAALRGYLFISGD
ncbi:hypothetical protein GCM10010277_81620 [Streptomyces longisporoflavus]|uniref:hypothetical protein n=1 Tax=Streptomyces longisporoflavus TaxID=28044 RepID=UPI0019CDA6C6|nr:hypothetical protein [Streptomyces longisporoflavus]GGV70544.1 hypothetical protein GCM10010277_81620 [Streptomyces longisporoflavus]